MASWNQTTLYSIGSGTGSNSIYKFSCGSGIDKCEWTKTNVELKYGRRGVRAFLIFDELADNICNIPNCNCDTTGSSGIACDASTGQCRCKTGFTGILCDSCECGYVGYMCDTWDEESYIDCDPFAPTSGRK